MLHAKGQHQQGHDVIVECQRQQRATVTGESPMPYVRVEVTCDVLQQRVDVITFQRDFIDHELCIAALEGFNPFVQVVICRKDLAVTVIDLVIDDGVARFHVSWVEIIALGVLTSAGCMPPKYRKDDGSEDGSSESQAWRGHTVTRRAAAATLRGNTHGDTGWQAAEHYRKYTHRCVTYMRWQKMLNGIILQWQLRSYTPRRSIKIPC